MSDMSLDDKLTQKSGLVAHRDISKVYSKGTYNNTLK